MSPEQIQSTLGQLIVGESAPVRELRSRILRVAPSELPVLIQGPTGSGKELVARAIHLASGRPGDFVAFNVCAVAEPMFEDALFGHARGAFTGAVTDTAGYLTEAHRGTVFLDEIGGLGLAPQAKLLRALETRAYRAVGGRRDSTSDFRTVTATNEPLAELMLDGRFREDLRYRLSACVVTVPPLAAHREDIAALARTFVARMPTPHRAAVADCAIDALEAYAWPGNVRELKHVVECAAVFARDGIIRAADVADTLPASAGRGISAPVGQITRRRLRQILEETSWDVRAAAHILGVHRATVYRRMKSCQLVTQSTSMLGQADTDAPAIPASVELRPDRLSTPPERQANTRSA